MTIHKRNKLMSDKRNPNTDLDQAVVYQIRVKGHLDQSWKDWLERMTLTLEDNGDTLLSCVVADQAALYGLLRKVRDVGLPLISVTRVNPGQADVSDVNSTQ
jgi:hypothetical protein